jgi:rhodanese-related sulfurtransferase
MTDEELTSGLVTRERLRTLLKSGGIILIDARSKSEFLAGHIAGAVNIPYDEFVDYFETLQARVPRDAVVVCYCESVTCDESENLSTELKLMGYETVLVYKGGWQEWEQEEQNTSETGGGYGG